MSIKCLQAIKWLNVLENCKKLYYIIKSIFKKTLIVWSPKLSYIKIMSHNMYQFRLVQIKQYKVHYRRYKILFFRFIVKYQDFQILNHVALNVYLTNEYMNLSRHQKTSPLRGLVLAPAEGCSLQFHQWEPTGPGSILQKICKKN